MNILTIDTSSAYCSVALFVDKNKKKVFSFNKYIPRKHNEQILPMIDKLIKEAKIKNRDINLLAYGLGPGSFVGIRIAEAVIKAMSIVLKCPVIGFSSMEAMAVNGYIKYKISPLTVIINANNSSVYIGKYQWNKDLKIMEKEYEKYLKKDQLLKLKKNENLIIGEKINNKLEIKECSINVKFLLSTVKNYYNKLKTKNKPNNIPEMINPIYLEGNSLWKK